MKFSANIFKYIAGLFTRDLLAILIATALIAFIFDYIELIRLTSANKNISNFILLKLGIFKNYTTLHKVLPFVVSVATIKTFHSLNRKFELIGIQNTGLPNLQIILPPILILVVFSILHLSLLMPMSSYLLSRYQNIENDEIKEKQTLLYPTTHDMWLKQIGQGNLENKLIIIRALQVDQGKKEMRDVDIFIMDNNGKFEERIHTKKLQAKTNQRWFMTKAQILNYKNQIYEKNNLEIHFQFSFDQLSDSLTVPEMVNIWNLREFIEVAEELGFSTVKYQSYFWRMIFKPLMLLAMLIIGYTMIENCPASDKMGLTSIKIIFLSILIYFSNELLVVYLTQKLNNAFLGTAIPFCLAFATSIYCFLHYKENI